MESHPGAPRSAWGMAYAAAWSCLLVLSARALGEPQEEPAPGTCPAGGGCGSPGAGGAGDAAGMHGMSGPTGESFWAMAGGSSNRSGASPHAAPPVARGPAWTWGRALVDVFRAPPLIDGGRCIYQLTSSGKAFKFSPSGETLWIYSHMYGIHGAGALMDGSLFASDHAGHVFALDTGTGAVQWRSPISRGSFRDGFAATLAYNGTVFVSAQVIQPRSHTIVPSAAPSPDEEKEQELTSENAQNMNIVAVSSRNGYLRWKFKLDVPCTSFMASTPGDGTIVFMDTEGTLYRLSVDRGDLVWTSVFHWLDVTRVSSTGNAVIGPNNMVYAVHKTLRAGGPGVVRAVRLSDGQAVWHRMMGEFEGNQAPAVGRLGGALAVVAGLGPSPGAPVAYQGFGRYHHLLGYLGAAAQYRVMYGVHALSQRLGPRAACLWRRLGYRVDFPSVVVALDAETGELRWQWEPPAWRRPAAAGDTELAEARTHKSQEPGHEHVEPMCRPPPWSQPVIAADGAVYVGHMDGHLYEIRDIDGNGVIESGTEVSSFRTGDNATAHAFVSGATIAPGMMVATPCGGEMLVFKS